MTTQSLSATEDMDAKGYLAGETGAKQSQLRAGTLCISVAWVAPDTCDILKQQAISSSNAEGDALGRLVPLPSAAGDYYCCSCSQGFGGLE